MVDTLSLDRTDRITGSRISGVLGLSPYRTRDDVMREMVREHFWFDSEFDGNFVTEWGSEHEGDAVSDYELVTGNRTAFTGDKQVTKVGGPGGIFAVTPDALVIPKGGDRVQGTLEVKCPYRALYTSLAERPDYETQVRLAILTHDLEWGDFGVWREASGINVTRAYYDRDLDGEKYKDGWLNSKLPGHEDTLIAEIEAFLEQYAGIIEHDVDHELVAPFLVGIPGYRYDPEWLAAAAAVLELQSEQDRISTALAAAKKEAEALTPERSSKGGGLHVVYSRPSGGGRGNVSWKKLAEKELGERLTPELQDKYRSAPSFGSARARGTYSFRRLNEK